MTPKLREAAKTINDLVKLHEDTHLRLCLAIADPLTKAKLEQLGWLRQNDVSEAVRKEAEKQYREIWTALERSYDAKEGE